MQDIKFVWIILSEGAVLTCNEPLESKPAGHAMMSQDMLDKVVKIIQNQSWQCLVLTDKRGITNTQQQLIASVKAQVVLPVDAAISCSYDHCAVAIEPAQIERVEGIPSTYQIILRIGRKNLLHLSEIIIPLLDRFKDVTLRHPEILIYDDEDLECYRGQLIKMAQWLLSKKTSWSKYRLACITDRFFALDSKENECGSGTAGIAIATNGDLYTCPAAYVNREPSVGNILTDLDIPHRHLFTREYACACKDCTATHCQRCVYLNKLGTGEWCVPTRIVCRLSHIEANVQACLADRLKKSRLWGEDCKAPSHPTLYDPVELIRKTDTDEEGIVDIWQRLVSFNGNPKNLSSSMMLDIVHSLYGWCEALSICAECGKVPSAEQIEGDVLSSLRRKTLEPYKDVILSENCPTVHDIEQLLCRVAQKGLDRIGKNTYSGRRPC